MSMQVRKAAPKDRGDLLKTLYTGVLSDVLDEMGHMNQALKPFVRPLDESLSFIGLARTGRYAASYSLAAGENPYELEIALIDDLKPGEVPVLACGGPTDRIAPWGELLTTAAMARGAAGCVTDGLVRDVRHIRKMKFPLFHGGIGPLDTKGRAKIAEIDAPIDCAGVRICTGDTLFGDVDGVVVIPRAIVDEVLARAFSKVTQENHTRDELRQGTLLGDVYRKYGVL